MVEASRVQFRQGDAAAWTAANAILAKGEPGYEEDTGRTKIGDGTTPWVDLNYVTDQAAPLIFGGDPDTIFGTGLPPDPPVPIDLGNTVDSASNGGRLALTTAERSAIATQQANYGVTVSVMSVIPAAEHAAIRAGTSTYNCTNVVQTLLDAYSSNVSITFPYGKFIIGNIQISNKTNFKLLGQGARLQLTGDGAAVNGVGLQLVGTIANVEIAGLHIVGDGDKTHKHAGVWNNSGQTISDLRIHHMLIEQVRVGISINANTGGTIDGFEITDNIVKDLVGIASGEGYGIHVAYANAASAKGLIARNRVYRAGRHAIYCARASDLDIVGNRIYGHRSTITTAEQADATDGRGKTRPALLVARSHNVRVYGNTIADGYDCGIALVPNPDLEVSVDLYDVAVSANHFLRPANNVPLLIIGDPTPSIAGVPTDIFIKDNDFYVDFAVMGGNSAELIQHNAGKGVVYQGNQLVARGINVTTAAINVFNREDASAGNAYNDDLYFLNNTARLTTSNASICRAIRLDGSVSTSAAKVTTRGNEGLGDCVNEPAVLTATVTNPNLRVHNRHGGAVGVYTAADTTPSIARGITELLITNAAAVSITMLDDGSEGQVVVLRFADSNTTLVNSTTIRLAGGVNYVGANRRTITLVLRSGAWYETARSNN